MSAGMQITWFTIPAMHPQAAQQELNRHLASHRVSHVDKQFVADGAASFWSVCVTTAKACGVNCGAAALHVLRTAVSAHTAVGSAA